MHQQNEGRQISTKTTYLPAYLSAYQRALGDIHFCFLSQPAYNQDILAKFVSKTEIYDTNRFNARRRIPLQRNRGMENA